MYFEAAFSKENLLITLSMILSRQSWITTTQTTRLAVTRKTLALFSNSNAKPLYFRSLSYGGLVTVNCTNLSGMRAIVSRQFSQ
jgi:hypothetical protein